MLGVNKNNEGYLIAYRKSTDVPGIIRNELYIYFAVILGIIIHILMLLSIKNKTKILKNEREWFKSITDSLSEGLFVMDINAKVTYINPIACEILGYKEEEVVGHYITDFMLKADATLFNDVYFYSIPEETNQIYN